MLIRVFPIYWEHDNALAALMVTITDLSDDEEVLLELFGHLDQDNRGLLIRQAAVAAYYAAVLREKAARQEEMRETDTPESVTLKELWRCVPRLPCGYESLGDGFEWQISDCVFSRLGERALPMILTTPAHDEVNAQVLAEWAHEFADQFGSDYCAPDFEEGYVDPASMQRFIEKWRESFMADLRRAYSRLSEPHRPQPKPWR